MSFLPDRWFVDAIGGVSFGYSYSVFFASGGTEVYDSKGTQIARIGPPLSEEDEHRVKEREKWVCDHCGGYAASGNSLCATCKSIGDG